MKSQEVANIGIAIMAVITIVMCWDSDGNRLFQAGLIWAGAHFGYLITAYLNQEDDGCQ